MRVVLLRTKTSLRIRSGSCAVLKEACSEAKASLLCKAAKAAREVAVLKSDLVPACSNS